MAEKNAKEALTRKIFESETNIKLLDQVADKFKLNISPRTIEVYDNSHIQGSQFCWCINYIWFRRFY